MVACTVPPTPTYPVQSTDIPDTRAVVPPLKESDLIRLRYAIRDGDDVVEHGVLEAGSWASYGILRLVNRLDASGGLLDANDPQKHGPVVIEADLSSALAAIWMGPDKTPWTQDDRPIVDLHSLRTKLRLDLYQWGALVKAVRAEKVFSNQPDTWVVLDGHAVTNAEAQVLLAAINRCSSERLKQVLRLPKRAVASLGERPFQAAEMFADAKGWNRGLIVRLHHHQQALRCTGEKPQNPLSQ